MARKKRYGMLIDMRRCIGCQACSIACKSENEVPLGIFWSGVKYVERGKYPNVRRYMLPWLCNHCENPPCLPSCPENAIFKRKDGIVLVDHKKCKNIQACILACPYSRISTHPITEKAVKCTFCPHRVDAGVVPSCVNTCQGRARIFGDLNDPTSEIARLVALSPVQVLKPEEGTGASVYYIAPDSTAMAEAAVSDVELADKADLW